MHISLLNLILLDSSFGSNPTAGTTGFGTNFSTGTNTALGGTTGAFGTGTGLFGGGLKAPQSTLSFGASTNTFKGFGEMIKILKINQFRFVHL